MKVRNEVFRLFDAHQILWNGKECVQAAMYSNKTEHGNE